MLERSRCRVVSNSGRSLRVGEFICADVNWPTLSDPPGNVLTIMSQSCWQLTNSDREAQHLR